MNVTGFVKDHNNAGSIRYSGIQLESMSVSILPKVPIRYSFYTFLFCMPFEERIGGLSLLGMTLAGLTLLQPRLFLQAPPRAFWGFGIYVVVVAGLGLALILQGQQNGEYRSELVFQLSRWFQLLVFFAIAYRMMTFEAIARRSLLVFSLSCVLLAILQVSGIVATEAHGRVTMYDFNPNVVALLLSVGLLSLLGLAHSPGQTSIMLRLFAWLGSAVLLLPIVETGSRGSQLALAVAIVVLLVKPESIPQRIKTGLIVLAVIGSLVWISYQVDTVRERWESTYYEGDIAGRDVLMPVAWEMFLERPIYGWGPVYHYWEMNIRTGDPDGGDPHNSYLWILKETGLLGSLPFLFGLWLCWSSAWKARGSSHGSLPLALLLLILANNMKGTYLFFKILWLLLAYVSASGNYSVKRFKAPTWTIRPSPRAA